MAERKTGDHPGAAPASNVTDMFIWTGMFIVELVRVSLKCDSVHSSPEMKLIFICPSTNVNTADEDSLDSSESSPEGVFQSKSTLTVLVAMQHSRGAAPLLS